MAEAIHQAIVNVMRQIGAIGKNSQNKSQGWNFRGVEEVYNRVQPLMAQNGIYAAPKVLDHEWKEGKSRDGKIMHWSIIRMQYTFTAEDGSSVEVVSSGEGMDTGDKSATKAQAIAHKYALCQLFNIPYEIVDPDAFTPDWARELNGGITMDELNEVKQGWWDLFQDEIGVDQATNIKVKRFEDFLGEATGRPLDPEKPTWTREEYLQALKYLEHLKAKPETKGKK